jgi:hypothetical protein
VRHFLYRFCGSPGLADLPISWLGVLLADLAPSALCLPRRILSPEPKSRYEPCITDDHGPRGAQGEAAGRSWSTVACKMECAVSK